MSGGMTERQALEASWGTDLCARCGAVLVLGEFVRKAVRRGRHETLCGECGMEPAVTLLRPFVAGRRQPAPVVAAGDGRDDLRREAA